MSRRGFLIPILVLWQLLFVQAAWPSTLRIPKEWRFRQERAGTFSFSPPHQERGIRVVSLAGVPGKSARDKLRHVVDSFRKQHPDLAVTGVRLDRLGTIAECRVSYSGRRGLMRERLRVFLSAGEAVLLEAYAPDALFPETSRLLDGTDSRRPTPLPRAFQTVQASDRTFTIRIPQGWKVTSAVLQAFQSWSPRGETLYAFIPDVVADRASFQNYLNYYVAPLQQAGVPIPREQLELQARMISPWLSPVDVVRVLYPRVSLRVQEMTILGSQNLFVGGAKVYQAAGVEGSVVHYTYTLLKNGGRIPMEGMATLATFPPGGNPYYRYWTFLSIGAEAPKAIFRRNLPVYLASLKSLTYNTRLIQQNLAAANQELDAWGRRMRELPFKMHEDWVNHVLWSNYQVAKALGGRSTYVSESRGSTVDISADYRDWFKDHPEAIPSWFKPEEIPDPENPDNPLRPARPGEW